MTPMEQAVAARHVSGITRDRAREPWIWSMLFGDDVVDLVQVPATGAIYAYCLECGAVMGPGAGAPWPSSNSAWMHGPKGRGVQHSPIHYVVPQPHQHSDWCAPVCGAKEALDHP